LGSPRVHCAAGRIDAATGLRERKFMKPGAFAITLVLFALVGLLPGSPAYGDVTITVWSHEADEPAKVAFREMAARNVERAHPGTHVKITWYEKTAMYAALRTALPAGQGPDVFYLEPDQTDYITSGYILPLDNLVDWNQIQPWARGTRVQGKTWMLPQEAYTVEIYYNKALLKKLGVTLPANVQFTQSQFLELVKKSRAAGITPIAEGVGDRPFPGAYLIGESLLHKLGPGDYGRLLHGQISFHDPRVVAVMNWVKQLVDAGAYPKNFMTLKLGETHSYFYQRPGALMFPVSSWFTGRAFAPVAQGGMPTDFPLGLMQFPAIDGAVCNECKTTGTGANFAINAATKHRDLAAAFLNAMSTPEMGRRWLKTIYLQTAVRTGDVEFTGPHASYFSELMDRQKGEKYFVGLPVVVTQDQCRDAWAQVMNAAFPGGLITVERAANLMDQACYRRN
jgi:multiple sugar transport system substrate-binding protein